MTRTGKAFGLTTVALYLIAAVNDKDLSYLMCWTTASLLVASYLLSRMSLSGVEVTAARLLDRAFEGHTVTLTLNLRNVGSLNKISLLIDLELTNETQGTTEVTQWHLPCLVAGAEVEESLAIRGMRRGVIPVRSVKLSSGDPLGFFTHRRTVPLEHVLTVYPQRIALPEAPAAVGGSEDRSSALEAPTGQGDDEFHAVRPFVDGDDLRRVHWPTTARTGRLSVREFEGTARKDAFLFVDLWRGQTEAPGEADSFETTLKVAAAIAEELLRRGGGVSVYLSGARPTHLPLDRGQRQLVRTLEALAWAQADGPLPVDKGLLSARGAFPVGGTLVLASAALPAGLAAAASAIRARQVNLVVAHAIHRPNKATPPRDETKLYRLLRATGTAVWPVEVRPLQELPLGTASAHPRTGSLPRRQPVVASAH